MIIKYNEKNMNRLSRKKKLGTALALSISLITTGCNQTVVDTNYGFDKALILGDDTAIIMDVATWSDYDGEQLQLITNDNMVILSSSFDTNPIIGSNETYSVENIAANALTSEGEITDLTSDNDETSYNRAFFDTKWTFNKAIIFNGNNALVLNIDRWKDYEGEQLKVKTEDGLILNLCSYNSKLINDMNSETKAKDFAEYYVGSDGIITDLSTDDRSNLNYEYFDFNYAFNKAIVMHDGSTLILPVETWCDYEGEQIQIKIPNGPVLLTDSYHTILVNDMNSETKAKDIAEYLSQTGKVEDLSANYTVNTSYNETILDLNYAYAYGILSGSNSASSVKINSWLDYEGEQLQIKLESGDVILSSSMMLNMLNGGSQEINTSILLDPYASNGKVIDNTNNGIDSKGYNKTIFDTEGKFTYALKVQDGNVTIIPLKGWRDFYNTDGKKGRNKYPFSQSSYSANQGRDLKRVLDILDGEDEDEKEASPNCEQLQLVLPDDTTLVTTAYNTVLINNKSDIYELAELFRGENGVITDLTPYVGEPSVGFWNYNHFDTKYYFNYAIFANGNNTQVLPVDKWLDFNEGEQLQIKFDKDSGMLTSFVNTTLVDSDNEELVSIIASALSGTLDNDKSQNKVYTNR